MVNFGDDLDDETGWPAVILEYDGDAALPPFESYREELRSPSDDPFARDAQ